MPYITSVLCRVLTILWFGAAVVLGSALQAAASGAVPPPPPPPSIKVPLPAKDSIPFVVAVHPYPPYTEARDGSPEGMMVDIVKIAAHRAGMRVILRQEPLDRIPALLRSGEVDAAFPLYRTAQRAELGTFCDTPVTNPETITIFTRRLSPWQFTGSLRSLADTRVGIVRGHSYGPELDKALEQGVLRNVTIFADFTQCYMALLEDRLDIMPMDLLLGRELARRYGTLGSVVQLAVVEQVFPRIVFGPGEKHARMAQQFCSGLDSIRQDGTARRIRGVFIGTYYGE